MTVPLHRASERTGYLEAGVALSTHLRRGEAMEESAEAALLYYVSFTMLSTCNGIRGGLLVHYHSVRDAKVNEAIQGYRSGEN